MNELKGPTEAGALADIIKDNFKPEVQTISHVNGRDVQVLIAPKGIEAQSLQDIVDRHLPVPARRKGTAQVTTLDSFIALANRFKDVESALYADPSMTAASLTAIFNYW